MTEITTPTYKLKITGSQEIDYRDGDIVTLGTLLDELHAKTPLSSFEVKPVPTFTDRWSYTINTADGRTWGQVLYKPLDGGLLDWGMDFLSESKWTRREFLSNNVPLRHLVIHLLANRGITHIEMEWL